MGPAFFVTDQDQCPVRVNRVILTVSRPLPVYP